MNLSAAPTCDLVAELMSRDDLSRYGLERNADYTKLRPLMCELNNLIVDECLCGDDGEQVVVGMDAFVDLLPQVRHFIEPTEHPFDNS
jgi:hypothetical protein